MKCKKGEYYCNDCEKCKPIPKGHHVMPNGDLMKDNEHIDEAGSLHHWFKGSKSKGGKPGWVQADGSPCANEPGETKTPKCFSSARLSALKRKGKKGENIIKSAVRRKRQEDPGQQSKSGGAKPTNVRTFSKGKKDKNYVKPEPGLKEMAEKKDHEYSMARSELDTVMNAAKRLKKKMGKKGEGNLEAWVQSKITKAADYIDTAADYVTNEEFTTLPLEIEIPNNIRDFNLGLMFRESLDFNKGMLFVFDEVGQKSFHMTETKIPLDIAFITEDGIIDSIKELEPYNENSVSSEGDVLTALEVNRGWFAENNVEVGDEIQIELDEAQRDIKGKGSGKKDACYHKVKSRYSVWPSAYASGALVKCRKAGAANWGNKSEEINHELDEKCWAGYEKKGMKTMFGKRYPNCVKKTRKEQVEEAVRLPAKTGNLVTTYLTYRGKYFSLRMFFPQTSMPKKSDVQAQVEKVYPGAKLLTFNISDYEPGQPILHAEESRRDCETIEETSEYDSRTSTEFSEETEGTLNELAPLIGAVAKVAGGAAARGIAARGAGIAAKGALRKKAVEYAAKKGGEMTADEVKKRLEKRFKNEEDDEVNEDWQSVNRKDKTDGLSPAAVKAYRRENPGSKLKTAVTKKPSELKAGSKDAKRRKSFCSRMSGMKKRLTSAKTARDPDSRINKALRRWNCN